MEYRYIGTTGLSVSNICLGTVDFSATADGFANRLMINHARDIDNWRGAETAQDAPSEVLEHLD